jgi:hypothetical protein
MGNLPCMPGKAKQVAHFQPQFGKSNQSTSPIKANDLIKMIGMNTEAIEFHVRRS